MVNLRMRTYFDDSAISCHVESKCHKMAILILPRGAPRGDENDDFWRTSGPHDCGWAAVVISITPRGPDSKENTVVMNEMIAKDDLNCLEYFVFELN